MDSVYATPQTLCHKEIRKRTYAEGTDSLAGAPDFLLVNLGQLLGVVFSVRLAVIELERAAGFGTVPDRLVEGLEHGQVGPTMSV